MNVEKLFENTQVETHQIIGVGFVSLLRIDLVGNLNWLTVSFM